MFNFRYIYFFLAEDGDPVRLGDFIQGCSLFGIFDQHHLQDLTSLLVFDNTEIDFPIFYVLAELHQICYTARRILSRYHVKQGYPQCPYICLLTTNFHIFSVFVLKHFWCKKQIGSQFVAEQVVIPLINQCAYAKVDEDGDIVATYHYIVRFYVAVDDFDHSVAVVECSEHIDEIQSRRAQRQPTFLLLDHVANASSAVILGDQVYVWLLLIIYYFVKPYYIWVLKTLENLQLLKHTIVGGFAFAGFSAFEHGFIHYFDCISTFGLLVLAQFDRRKRPFAQFLQHFVLIYHQSSLLFECLERGRALDRRLANPRCSPDLSGIAIEKYAFVTI